MRKTTILIFGLLAGCVFLTSCSAEIQKDSATNPNKPAPPAVQPPAQQNTTASSAGNVSIDEKLGEFEKYSLKEQIESYKESVSCLKWAIGSLVGLSLAAVGFIVFKNEKAYKEAIADAKDAAKQAREEAKVASEHREKACEWEQKAREKYEDIDAQIKIRIEGFNKQADDKFKDIDDKIKELGNKAKSQVKEEGQKQRGLSEKWSSALRADDEKNYELADKLWAEIVRENPADCGALNNWGNALADWADLGGPEAEKHYQEACAKYQKATNIKSDNEVFYNWGSALLGWARLGGPEAEKRYQEACAKYQKAIELKPDYYQAFNNWGATLSGWAKLGGTDEAEKRYQEACAKFQKATGIKPDLREAFNNWGIALLNWAKLKDGQEKEKLYQEAEDVLLKADEIKRGSGAYNLACLFALRKNEDKCREWLKAGEEAKTLPPREHAMKDEDLASVRDKDWFKAIRWKGE